VKLAQQEALRRYYSNVEQEVLDQTKIAQEAVKLNSAFEARLQNEATTRNQRIKTMNDAQLKAI